MKYRNIIFDLDGTLINSAVGVTSGVKYAAEKMNFPAPTEEELRSCIGPPLMSSFKRLFGAEARQPKKPFASTGNTTPPPANTNVPCTTA